MPMAAKLCASNKWQGIFYLSGGLAGVWAIIWLLLASNSPAKSRIISLDERNFLEKKLADSSKKVCNYYSNMFSCQIIFY